MCFDPDDLEPVTLTATLFVMTLFRCWRSCRCLFHPAWKLQEDTVQPEMPEPVCNETSNQDYNGVVGTYGFCLQRSILWDAFLLWRLGLPCDVQEVLLHSRKWRHLQWGSNEPWRQLPCRSGYGAYWHQVRPQHGKEAADIAVSSEHQ